MARKPSNEVREEFGRYGAGLPTSNYSPLAQRGFAVMAHLTARFAIRGIPVHLSWVDEDSDQFAILAVVMAGHLRGQWVIVTVTDEYDTNQSDL